MSQEVRVEVAGNRILLGSDFPTPGLKESIPGAYFRKDGVWSVPLDLTTCFLLRERFGQRLRIGPELNAWARAEKAQRASQAATAASDYAELKRLPIVAPDLFAAMSSRAYQYAAVQFVTNGLGRDGRRRALIADTVGLGKTVEAIAAVLESGADGPYLVVCPKTAVEATWAPEIRRWLGKSAEIVTLPDGKAQRSSMIENLHKTYLRHPASLRNTWIIVNPAVIRTQTWFVCEKCREKTKFRAGMVQELDCGHLKTKATKVRHDHAFHRLFELEYGAVIADESDQILIRRTGTPNLQRRGMEMIRDQVREGGCRIAMSGTPFRSKPHQIWSTLNWLDPVRWSAKWSFLEKFWKVSKAGYGGSYTIGDLDPEREPMLIGELQDVMIRRTREQVRADLPPKNYPTNVADRDDLTPGIYLPMTGAQERAYNEMLKMGEVELEGGTLNTIGHLAEMTRLKQFANSTGRLDLDGVFLPKAEGNKFDWIEEFLEQLGFPDEPSTKIVIASQFTSLLNVFAPAFSERFKANRNPMRYGMITGETKNRSAIVDEFEDTSSGLNVLFLNTKAGGSAITLDAAEVMVVIDETWVDDEQQQLEGRIDNRQPERRIVPRSYYYLRSFNSVQEGIARRNAEAKRIGAKILDAGDFAKMGRDVLR